MMTVLLASLVRQPFSCVGLLLLLVALVGAQEQSTPSVCTSSNNVFHVQVDIFSSTYV